MTGAPAEPEELARAAERWRECGEDGEETTLLRLAILRDLVRLIHARKSRCLATGRKPEAGSLTALESRLAALRGSARLSGELRDAVAATVPPRKRTRLLPEALFEALPREKLKRFDREWEETIAAEALSIGWRVWSLEASVTPALAEVWDAALAGALWPYGITLFAESAAGPGPEPAGAPPDHPDTWRGRWILLVHPRFERFEELPLDLSRLAGGARSPRWKLLFSPKRR